MIFTFDPDKYRDLLYKYQPKIIRIEEENQKALEIVEALMHSQNRTPEEDELYELLIVLIEKFEREYYAPGEGSTPHSMFHFLMEQQGIKQADLVGVIGSKRMFEKSTVVSRSPLTPLKKGGTTFSKSSFLRRI